MNPTKLKIVTPVELNALVKRWKSGGEQVVFTNGCFDLLHLGHITLLEKARTLGDKLIVGVNSDPSVRGLKGDGRPLNDEHARSRIIAALDFVDAVVIFNEETPEELIKTILPDVLVKGNDYKKSNIAGADIVLGNGGRVETIELISGYSTTNIIERITKN